jgi:glucose 1-dehydrogenase
MMVGSSAMRALTVRPHQSGSACVADVAEPTPGTDELVVAGLAVGVCGTDVEIVNGEYGWPPSGCDRLVLGHESIGRVRTALPGSGFHEGDLVVGVVRRPDPVPCGACAQDEFDMCRNGQYTERGIKELDGYASELWCIPARYAVVVDPRLADVGMLLEPTSVVAKAWEQIDGVGARSWFAPERALITGAGPIGLLAAMLGVQRGLEVHVLDRVTEGPKPAAVAALGATYHSAPAANVACQLRPDVIIEATGASSVVFDAIAGTAPYGIVCLTGVSPVGRRLSVDVGALSREVVLENDVVVGSVNANRRHYAAAADALAAADLDWLAGLITRRVPLERFAEAFTSQPDDIKVVITLEESG